MAQIEAVQVPTKQPRGRPPSLVSVLSDTTLEASALLRQAAQSHLRSVQLATEIKDLIERAVDLMGELEQCQAQATRFTVEAFKAQRLVNGYAERLPRTG
jgi:hypothetical protein